MTEEQITINWRVIESNTAEQSIVVRYTTDFLTEEQLAVNADRNPVDGTPMRCRTDYNLNVWDAIKTEDALKKFINDSAPIDWFRIQHNVIKGVANTAKIDMIRGIISSGSQTYIVPVVPPAPSTADLTPEEIDALIAKATANT